MPHAIDIIINSTKAITSINNIVKSTGALDKQATKLNSTLSKTLLNKKLASDFTKASKSAGAFDKQASRLNKTLSKTQLNKKLASDFTKASNSAKQLTKELSKQNKEASRLTGTIKGLIAAYAGFNTLKSLIVLGAKFYAQLDKISAISGIDKTSKQFSELEKTIRGVASTSSKTATEVAQASEFIALSGANATQIMQLLPTVIEGSVATSQDLASVTTVLTDRMNSMGISYANSTGFLDKMVRTTSNASTNFSQLAEATKLSSVVFHSAGQSVDTLFTSVGILADNGIKGEMANSALVASLQRLTTLGVTNKLDEMGVSVKDNEGNFKNLDVILGEVNESLEGYGNVDKLAKMTELFGEHAGKMIILSDAIDSGDFANKFDIIANGSQTAGEMAAQMSDNLVGAYGRLNSSMEELGLTVYESLDAPLTSVTNAFTSAITAITPFVPLLVDLAMVAGVSAAALYGIPVALSMISRSLITVSSSMTVASVSGLRFGTMLYGVSVASQVASGSLSKVALGVAVVGSAFAGWQIGTYAWNHFGAVRHAGYAAIGFLLKGFEMLKLGTFAILNAISVTWQGAVTYVANIFGKAVGFISSAAATIPIAFQQPLSAIKTMFFNAMSYVTSLVAGAFSKLASVGSKLSFLPGVGTAVAKLQGFSDSIKLTAAEMGNVAANTSFSKAVKVATFSIEANTQAMYNNDDISLDYKSGLDALMSTYSTNTSAISKNISELQDYNIEQQFAKTKVDKASKATGKATKNAKALGGATGNAAKNAKDLGGAAGGAAKKAKDLGKAAGGAGKATKGHGEEAQKAGKAIKEQADKISDLIKELKKESEEIGRTSVQKKEHEARNLGASESVIKLVTALQREIEVKKVLFDIDTKLSEVGKSEQSIELQKLQHLGVSESVLSEVKAKQALLAINTELSKATTEKSNVGLSDIEIESKRLFEIGVSQDDIDKLNEIKTSTIALTEVDKTRKDLLEEIATANMNSSQKQIYELEKLGATEKEINEIKKHQHEIVTNNLSEELKLLSMNADEKERYKFIQKNTTKDATEQSQQVVGGLYDQIEAQKKYNDEVNKISKMSDTFLDNVLSGNKSIKESFSDLTDDMSSMWQDTFKEMAKQQLKSLFNPAQGVSTQGVSTQGVSTQGVSTGTGFDFSSITDMDFGGVGKAFSNFDFGNISDSIGGVTDAFSGLTGSASMATDATGFLGSGMSGMNVGMGAASAAMSLMNGDTEGAAMGMTQLALSMTPLGPLGGAVGAQLVQMSGIFAEWTTEAEWVTVEINGLTADFSKGIREVKDGMFGGTRTSYEDLGQEELALLNERFKEIKETVETVSNSIGEFDVNLMEGMGDFQVRIEDREGIGEEKLKESFEIAQKQMLIHAIDNIMIPDVSDDTKALSDQVSDIVSGRVEQLMGLFTDVSSLDYDIAVADSTWNGDLDRILGDFEANSGKYHAKLTAGLNDSIRSMSLEDMNTKEIQDSLSKQIPKLFKNIGVNDLPQSTFDNLSKTLAIRINDAIEFVETGVSEFSVTSDFTYFKTLKDMVKSFEGSDKELTKFINSMTELKNNFKLTGLNTDSITESFINTSGGIDELSSNLGTFKDKFITDTMIAFNESVAVGETIKGTFESLNLAIPATRQGFVDLVTDVDLTEQQLSKLLSISGDMDVFFSHTNDLIAKFGENIFALGSSISETDVSKSLSSASTGEEFAQDITDQMKQKMTDAMMSSISSSIHQSLIQPMMQATTMKINSELQAASTKNNIELQTSNIKSNSELQVSNIKNNSDLQTSNIKNNSELQASNITSNQSIQSGSIAGQSLTNGASSAAQILAAGGQGARDYIDSVIEQVKRSLEVMKAVMADSEIKSMFESITPALTEIGNSAISVRESVMPITAVYEEVKEQSEDTKETAKENKDLADEALETAKKATENWEKLSEVMLKLNANFNETQNTITNFNSKYGESIELQGIISSNTQDIAQKFSQLDSEGFDELLKSTEEFSSGISGLSESLVDDVVKYLQAKQQIEGDIKASQVNLDKMTTSLSSELFELQEFDKLFSNIQGLNPEQIINREAFKESFSDITKDLSSTELFNEYNDILGSLDSEQLVVFANSLGLSYEQLLGGMETHLQAVQFNENEITEAQAEATKAQIEAQTEKLEFDKENLLELKKINATELELIEFDRKEKLASAIEVNGDLSIINALFDAKILEVHKEANQERLEQEEEFLQSTLEFKNTYLDNVKAIESDTLEYQIDLLSTERKAELELAEKFGVDKLLVHKHFNSLELNAANEHYEALTTFQDSLSKDFKLEALTNDLESLGTDFETVQAQIATFTTEEIAAYATSIGMEFDEITGHTQTYLDNLKESNEQSEAFMKEVATLVDPASLNEKMDAMGLFTASYEKSLDDQLESLGKYYTDAGNQEGRSDEQNTEIISFIESIKEQKAVFDDAKKSAQSFALSLSYQSLGLSDNEIVIDSITDKYKGFAVLNQSVDDVILSLSKMTDGELVNLANDYGQTFETFEGDMISFIDALKVEVDENKALNDEIIEAQKEQLEAQKAQLKEQLEIRNTLIDLIDSTIDNVNTSLDSFKSEETIDAENATYISDVMSSISSITLSDPAQLTDQVNKLNEVQGLIVESTNARLEGLQTEHDATIAFFEKIESDLLSLTDNIQSSLNKINPQPLLNASEGFDNINNAIDIETKIEHSKTLHKAITDNLKLETDSIKSASKQRLASIKETAKAQNKMAKEFRKGILDLQKAANKVSGSISSDISKILRSMGDTSSTMIEISDSMKPSKSNIALIDQQRKNIVANLKTQISLEKEKFKVAKKNHSKLMKFANSLTNVWDSINLDKNLSTLTASERLGEAGSQYQTALDLAKKGDSDAQSELPKLIKALLNEQKQYYAVGSQEYLELSDRLKAESQGLIDATTLEAQQIADEFPIDATETGDNIGKIKELQGEAVAELQRLDEVLGTMDSHLEGQLEKPEAKGISDEDLNQLLTNENNSTQLLIDELEKNATNDLNKLQDIVDTMLLENELAVELEMTAYEVQVLEIEAQAIEQLNTINTALTDLKTSLLDAPADKFITISEPLTNLVDLENIKAEGKALELEGNLINREADLERESLNREADKEVLLANREADKETSLANREADKEILLTNRELDYATEEARHLNKMATFNRYFIDSLTNLNIIHLDLVPLVTVPTSLTTINNSILSSGYGVVSAINGMVSSITGMLATMSAANSSQKEINKFHTGGVSDNEQIALIRKDEIIIDPQSSKILQNYGIQVKTDKPVDSKEQIEATKETNELLEKLINALLFSSELNSKQQKEINKGISTVASNTLDDRVQEGVSL